MFFLKKNTRKPQSRWENKIFKSSLECVNYCQVLFIEVNSFHVILSAISAGLPQPVLAEVNSDSVLIRDDFETSDFNPQIWYVVYCTAIVCGWTVRCTINNKNNNKL